MTLESLTPSSESMMDELLKDVTASLSDVIKAINIDKE
jgi:hypothetical protein